MILVLNAPKQVATENGVTKKYVETQLRVQSVSATRMFLNLFRIWKHFPMVSRGGQQGNIHKKHQT